jgi:hypothetical protein
LYTGGKVPPAAYAPAARAIAERGFLVAIVPAPFNSRSLTRTLPRRCSMTTPRSQLGPSRHSLGGASAALIADGHQGAIDGLALWASYSSADLADDGLRVVSIYGSSIRRGDIH